MIPTPKSWSRIRSLTFLYADTAQRGYLDFLNFEDQIRAFGEVEYDEQLEDLKRKHQIAGLQTIVFAGMCFEAAIYEYAAIHLGDRYVQDHLDKLDVLSKWIVVLRFVSGYELPKDRAAYAALKQLIMARNRLVHSKSEEIDYANIVAQLRKIELEDAAHQKDVHNAFRAIVLMSTEIEKFVGASANPLPSFNHKIALLLNVPERLRKTVEDCRSIVHRKRDS